MDWLLIQFTNRWLSPITDIHSYVTFTHTGHLFIQDGQLIGWSPICKVHPYRTFSLMGVYPTGCSPIHSPILDVYSYGIFTYMWHSPIQDNHSFCTFTYIWYSPILCMVRYVHPYGTFTRKWGPPIKDIHPYKIFTHMERSDIWYSHPYIMVCANTRKWVSPRWQKCYRVMKVLKAIQGQNQWFKT